MGPGFLTFFPPGEAVTRIPMQIKLNLVNYSNTKLNVKKSASFALSVVTKSEHRLGLII